VQIISEGKIAMKNILNRQRNGLRFFAAILLMGALPGIFVVNAKAQEPPIPVDPTPLMQLLPPDEKARVEKENKSKKLVEIFLKIADTHLEIAYNAVMKEDQRTPVRELDIYNKALDAAKEQAFSQADEKRRLAKKVEQGILKQLKTLDLVERYSANELLPFSQAANKHAKHIRGQALNASFDSGDVITDPEKEKGKKSSDNQSIYIVPRVSNSSQIVLKRLVALRKDYTMVAPQLANDYMTEEEDDLVREAQQPDLRMKVFMKIAERRLQMINKPPVAADDKKAQKQAEEETRRWGKLPELNLAGYLKHYAKAVDEAMAKLDDAYERNPKASFVAKALKVLREATEEQLKLLHQLEAQVKTEEEKRALSDAIENAERANKGASEGLKKIGS
jgi:hypothetical protein